MLSVSYNSIRNFACSHYHTNLLNYTRGSKDRTIKRGIVRNMLLAVDVGNTQTVVGVYEGKDLRHRWRFSTNKLYTPDELRIKTMPLLASENMAFEDVHGVVVSSVVPRLTDAWCEVTRRTIGRPAVVCTAETAGSLFPTSYPNPSEIGADRVADAVGACALYGAPVVVVDFGTATNIEVVDRDGTFLGGAIAPGMDTAASALFEHATKLGAIDYVNPRTAIGTNTVQAMQIGIVAGEAERVDGIVSRMFDQLGYKAPVVATGGLARRIAPLSRTITETNPDLTLEGLRLVYEHCVDREEAVVCERIGY